MKIALAARWIFPMDRAPLRDAAVIAENGRIVEVAPADALLAAHPDARWTDLGNSALLPGLINAHTHLELSALERIEPEPVPGDPSAPRSLGAWLGRIIAARADGDPERMALRGAQLGRDQCLRFGVSSVGDITRYPAATRRVLRDGPLRTTSFGEIQALGRRRVLLEERLGAATEADQGSRWVRVAVSPHAPYTVEPEGYRRALEVARQRNLPLSTHLAESRAERSFLSHGTGELRELWDALGAWDDAVPRCRRGPIHLAAELGLLHDPRVLLAHVNYCSNQELSLLAAGVASVVWCPRTHAYFGHPPHRFREMLERGINVCIGTDSCVSSPDMNVVDDLRLVHRQCPDLPPDTLWSMITLRAARALDAGDLVGSIAPGKRADLVAFALTGRTAQPLRQILESDRLPSGLWIDGRPIQA